MNTLLMILSILFLFAGIVGGISESNYGMMFAGICLGVVLLIWRTNRIKNEPMIQQRKEEERKIKKQQQLYKYYLTEDGKKALMEFIPKEELEQNSWETIAYNFSTEIGQKVLHDYAKEQVEQEQQEEQ